MFDEFVKQARRLFSSKSNGGKQVPTITDRLHTHKQVMLALSIVLLLGHSQFRSHFSCQSAKGVDAKTITDFCLINGTTTVLQSDSSEARENSPHVGLHFVTSSSDYRLINHNYMRSLWFLLIVLGIFSFIAQRKWASLFQNDALQALLQLVGSENSKLVQAGEKARPYEMLASLSSDLTLELEQRLESNPKFAELPKSERALKRIELVDNHVNIYDHKLDYYPNQLVYLLLTKNAALYKMSNLKLGRRLIIYSLQSTFFTLLQFVVPYLVMGPEYKLYGWNWALALLANVSRLFAGGHLDNSIDYELSSSLFPITTQCEYLQYGLVGETERLVVQCTVAMNEICGKLFALIWWFTVVNIVIELYHLGWYCLSAMSVHALSWTFGMRCWPGAYDEAHLLASFRHRRAALLAAGCLLAHARDQLDARDTQQQATDLVEASAAAAKRKSALGLELSANLDAIQYGQKQSKLDSAARELQEKQERKRLEAEDLERGAGGRRRRKSSSGTWSVHKLLRFISSRVCRLLCCLTKRRRDELEREHKCDNNIYYLLYLLHLRLGKSRSRTEEVIKMTAKALENYLIDRETGQEAQHHQLMLRQHQQHQAQSQQQQQQIVDEHHGASRPIISESTPSEEAKLMS